MATMNIDETALSELVQAFGEDIAREALESYFRNIASVPENQDREWLYACAAVEKALQS
jgi:hypothetical protein